MASQAPGVNCNVIPAAVFDPVGQKMMQLYPISNAANAALGFNFTNVPVRSLNEGEFDARVDHNFSSKDSAVRALQLRPGNQFHSGWLAGICRAQSVRQLPEIINRGRNVAMSETHIFSDRNINQFTAGFNRIFNHILHSETDLRGR